MKVFHHIRHTRPQWYREYHEWQYHSVLHWATFVVSTIIIVMAFVNVMVEFTQNAPVRTANAAQTHVRQDITGGALTIAQSGDEYMATVSASVNHQDTTGDLGTITVTDNTGSGNGWSATAQSTNFYKYNTPATTSGVNSITLGNSTPYATSSAGTYTITIDTGGTPGTATFDVTGLETVNDAATTGGSDIAIGTRGLKVNFSGTYSSGDQWTIRVDTIPVTGFRIAPGSVTSPITNSSLTNVTAGSTQFFADGDFNGSFIASLMSASSGYGMGSYQVSPTLQLGIPASSYASQYIARVTLTVQ